MMKLSEHKISEVCQEQNAEKYLKIANAQKGKQKLTCYVAKVLQENKISTFLPNVVVGIWKMFPEIPGFHLKWFDDFPDSDNIARYVNLHSRAAEDNYMVGGNQDRSGNTSYQLTPKGIGWANEVEEILTGKKPAPVVIATKKQKDITNYDQILDPITGSDLFKEFCDELDDAADPNKVMDDYKISKMVLCGTFGIYYPQSKKNSNDKPYDRERKKVVDFLKDKLAEAKTDGIEIDNSEKIALFLKWMEGRKIV